MYSIKLIWYLFLMQVDHLHVASLVDHFLNAKERRRDHAHQLVHMYLFLFPIQLPPKYTSQPMVHVPLPLGDGSFVQRPTRVIVEHKA